jgi:hypothetical protein
LNLTPLFFLNQSALVIALSSLLMPAEGQALIRLQAALNFWGELKYF